MTVTELLADLIRTGVQLRADGDQLIVRAPKGTPTQMQRRTLAEHKAEILARLRDSSGNSMSLSAPSYGQKALWFEYQLAPESTSYNIMYAARICSDLNVPALRQAFQALIDRHACLRTTFTAIEGEPTQLVHDYMELQFTVIEASGWSLDELKNRMEEEADSAFDLERGPVLRVSLFARSAMEHFILLTIHHIAYDFLSLGVLINELRILYNAANRAESVSLPPLTTQYQDYVRWQTEMVAGPEGQKLWDYWQRQLSGGLPALNIPIDRPRPDVRRYLAATQNFIVGDDLTRQLKDFAKAEQATLYMTLLAVFQVLLHRYTAQEDILVGSPTAGRSRTEFLPIIGYFVNPVALRVDVSGNPSFKAFLRRVSGVVLGALEHSDYPFPLLVQRLQPVRDLSRSALFQVVFVWNTVNSRPGPHDALALLESKDAGPPNSSTLEMEMIDGGQRGSDFDLVLTVYEQGKSLSAEWRYNTDLFDATTISRITGHFQTLLKAIVSDPEQRVLDVAILTDAERYQLLVEWNDTARDYPKDKCIHELFEEQVERTPDAIAVVFEDKQLTYRELNARANQLAHYLRKLGVGPELLVGICLDRSLELVVGVLAVLKAGGAYVPFDPLYPKERLAFMFADAGVATLVTKHSLIAALPAHSATVVCLDRDWDVMCHNEENPVSDISPENLAYIIYTSGSTGAPKGVMVPHRGLCNVSQEQIRAFDVKPGIRVLQFASMSFDASIFEIIMALSSGATLCLAPLDSMLPGSTLIRLLQDHAINIVTLPPSTLAALPVKKLPDLRTILVAGEPCSSNIVESWSSNRRFFNLYGPTETTIWASMAECFPRGGTPSIGRPISNTQIYILGSSLEPLPVGVPGELCIGGAGVARGYLNRPELTEEKFIADLFSQKPGARIYRTGDLARYLADGNIELLGRIDHQVKLRGFRIELGEIEAVLRDHPALRDAVVLAREDVPGDKRLVSYVVADKDTPPTTGELRSFLQQKLPDHMVPGVFVFLEALPLTPNGKVDRRTLPAPDTARPELESVFVAPESGVEKTLAEIWRGVLGIERPGIHDNFFDLGGHSLLMARAHSQLKEALGRDIPMVELFRYPTISTLAEHLVDASGQRSSEQSSSRAEKQRLALQNQQQRMQAIAGLRGAGRQGRG